MNVADEAEVGDAMTRVASDFGRLDGLVNNAGIVRDGLLVKVKEGAVVGSMSLDQWNAVIGVNLTGVFLCGREAAKHMIERGNGGVIVNISSISRHRKCGPDQLQRGQGGGRIHGGGLGEGTRPIRHPCGLGGSGLHAYRDPHLDAAGSAREDDRTGTAETPRAARGNRAGRGVHFQNDFFTGRCLEIDGGLRL